MNASLVSVSASSFLNKLLLWPIQENVRSTTHRRGRAWKPLGGNSFSQSTSTPSSLHCSAHDLRTSSGAGLRGRSTRSTVHPKNFSTQPLPFSSPLYPASSHRCERRGNSSLAPSSSSLIPS